MSKELKTTIKNLKEMLRTEGAMIFGFVQGTLDSHKLIIDVKEIHAILLGNQSKEDDFKISLNFELNENKVYRLKEVNALCVNRVVEDKKWIKKR